jgi:hypothetical protein
MGQEFAPRPRKWTVEEGAKLTSTVQEYGDSNSAAVAALVPGRRINSVVLDGSEIGPLHRTYDG